MSDKRFLCRIGWHKLVDIKTQYTKYMRFGYTGCEMPGMRVTECCKYCDDIKYMSLNLCMPNKYLYQEEIWE
ncbi:hypothetical protein LCGC14_1329600 [marine sediment metagenome]|uniref:Uncharacterized protein n=1 Tax=marine sediment metagenome TaxID=412755 RepID=A0A0F9NJJ3_9ZZZZ